MAISFDRLNLWPSLLSNKIVVDICKKIPMTKALILVRYTGAIDVVLDTNVPNGVIAAKINIKLIVFSLI